MADWIRILLVDDNPDDRMLAARELRRVFPNAQLFEAGNSRELDAMMAQQFDLVITDFHLRWTDGLVVLRTVKEQNPGCPVIMFTGTGTEEVAVEAMKAGLSDYVLKSPKHYVRLAAAAQSILGQVAAERRADELGNRLEKLLNRLNVGIFRAMANGLILEANPAFLKLIGWKALPKDAHLQELYFHPEIYAEHLRQLQDKGNLHNHELEFCRVDGAPLWISMTQSLSLDSQSELVIDGLVTDISERMALEEQLRKTQKMESIGQLAAGVAHDFNNLLTIVQGYTNLILAESHEAEVIESMKKISGAAERAAALTRQLLTFGRKQVMVPEPLTLNDVLGNLSSVLRHIIGERIQLQIQLDTALPKVMADPAMIEQVIVNLAANARDAMSEGGLLTIASGTVDIDQSYARRNSEAEQGTFVRLHFSDTGRGMDASALSHVFEPFYTTKEVGRGPGLGLAAVYGIVKQHRGWIDVTSKVGQGTTFSIYLPCAPKGIPSVEMPDASHSDAQRETVLVVEDEPELLDLVSDILKSQGYQVLQASSGVRALDVWKSNREKIDLLLTDMKMPDGIGGLELAEILTTQKPRLKVLYTSGYSPDLVQGGFVLREDMNFLPKPYPPEKLLSAVRNCLVEEKKAVVAAS